MSNPEFVCVLDFEATCDGSKNYDNEIIEFPSVLMRFDGTEYTVVSIFQQYCKPSRNPTVSNFCLELTGITQEMVNNGNKFINSLNDHHKWLINETNGNVIFVTCGAWDLGTVMINECKKWKTIPPTTYLKFVNISTEFKKFYKSSGGAGMKRMLEYLGIELTGRHHSGIDDCRNIAKIWQKMVEHGYILSNHSINRVDKSMYQTK